MTQLSPQTQDHLQKASERPKMYDMEKIREEMEDFIRFHEQLSLEMNNNKGYIRELISNDDYAFGTYVSLRVLENMRPKVQYCYEMLKLRNITSDEAETITSGTDYLWMNNVPISALLEAANIRSPSETWM